MAERFHENKTILLLYTLNWPINLDLNNLNGYLCGEGADSSVHRKSVRFGEQVPYYAG